MNLRKKVLRIAVVGPVYPYKGGIAHYTSLLAKELAKTHQVKVFSFSLQYPRLIYPGEQQKDYENDSFKVEGTEYTINSINPLTWATTAWSISRFAPDLIIFPWWNPFFGPAFYTIALISKLLHKTKVLFLIHNFFPHERLPLDRVITVKTLSRGDYHIVQSGENEAKLQRFLSHPVYRKTFHPTYGHFNQEEITSKEARERLSLPPEAKILLFFGFVREYKGLTYLIKALRLIHEHVAEIKLLIVGDFYDDKQKYVRQIEEAKVSDIIEIHDGYIPDQRVGLYFGASDLVVLPYVSATQSGIVQIAYGFKKPVVATSVGGLPEVVDNGRTGFVVPPQDVEALAEAVVQFFVLNKSAEFTAAIEQEQEKYSWGRMTEAIESLLREAE